MKEVPTRFELVIEVLQTFALPLGYGTIFITSKTEKEGFEPSRRLPDLHP